LNVSFLVAIRADQFARAVHSPFPIDAQNSAEIAFPNG